MKSVQAGRLLDNYHQNKRYYDSCHILKILKKINLKGWFKVPIQNVVGPVIGNNN